MDPHLDHLAAMVRTCPPSAGSTRVVAVDGPSGSGKTTLAGELSARLDGAATVHMDHLYPGWDGLEESVPRLVEWVLEPLSRGDSGRYRRFDWDAGEYAEWHEVPSSPVVIVEGAGCGARRSAAHLALLIWLDAPTRLRFERGICRDGDTYRPHWERWARQEQAHFAAEQTRSRADVRVETSVPGQWRLTVGT